MKKIGIVLALIAVIAIGIFGYRAYLIGELRKPVLAELNDPDSAQFRNEWLLFGLFNWPPKANVLCGEVNAKNRMGGYVGYVRFSALSGVHAEIGSNDLRLEVVDADCSKDG